VKSALMDGWSMFMFRSTESLYGVANAFLLGLYSTPVIVGYFGAAEKISKATAGLMNPIRESLYPRISNLVHQDHKEAVRLGKIGALYMICAGSFLSISLLVFAGPLITTLLGGPFEPAVRVLRILSPLPALISVTGFSGQLWLLPRKHDRTVLRVVFRAALVNLTLSFILAPRYGHIGMASAVLVSETLVAFSLLWNVVLLTRGTLAQEAPVPSI
jgi:polysaccharide transporter, PST family